MGHIQFKSNPKKVFELWGKGTTTCQVVGIEYKPNSKNNNTMHLKLEACDGKHEGTSILDFIVLLPQSTFRLQNLLEAAGVEYEEVDDTDGEEGATITTFDDDDLMGRRIVVKHEDEEYNGRTNTRVKGYGPAAKAAVKASKDGTTRKTENLRARNADVDQDEPEVRDEAPAERPRRGATTTAGAAPANGERRSRQLTA